MITTKAKIFIWTIIIVAGFVGHVVGGRMVYARQPHSAMVFVGAAFSFACSGAALWVFRWLLRQIATLDRLESDETPLDIAKAIGRARYLPCAVFSSVSSSPGCPAEIAAIPESKALLHQRADTI